MNAPVQRADDCLRSPVGQKFGLSQAKLTCSIDAREHRRARERRIVEVFALKPRFPPDGRGDEVGRVEDLRQRRDAVVDEHGGAAAQRVRQPLHEAGRRERPHLGAAAADRDRRVGVRTDERDGLQLLPVERQQLAVVLQQHQAGAGRVERHRAPLFAVERKAGVDGRTIEPAEADGGAQDPSDLVVDRRLRDLAGLDGG